MGTVPSAHPHTRCSPCWNTPPHIAHHPDALDALFSNISSIPSTFARGLGCGPSAGEVILHDLFLHSSPQSPLSLSPDHEPCAQHERHFLSCTDVRGRVDIARPVVIEHIRCIQCGWEWWERKGDTKLVRPNMGIVNRSAAMDWRSDGGRRRDGKRAWRTVRLHGVTAMRGGRVRQVHGADMDMYDGVGK